MSNRKKRNESLKEILVVDLEATTWENKSVEKKESEIIEIGCSLLNLATKEIEKKREILVKPVINPILSDFCVSLTSITQDDLNTRGIPFANATYILMDEFDSKDKIWASWGVYDRNMFQRQCKGFNCVYPFSEHHIDVKTLFSLFFDYNYRMGMKRALQLTGLELEGTHHRGLDDSYNIAKLLRHIFCG